MSIDLTRAELDIARRVAIGSVQRYPTYVERGDVEQELCVWMLRHEEKVREWRERTAGQKALYKTLAREAHRYCEREKAARVGYKPEDNTGYSWMVLREYLSDALKDDWSMVDGVEGEPHTPKAHILIDIRRGLPMLGERHAEVLVLAVEAGFDYQWMAEQWTTEDYAPTDEAMRQRVIAALKRLAKVLSEPRIERNPYRDVPRYSDSDVLRRQLDEAA